LDSKFNSDVQLENRVDAAILGGVIVNVEGIVLDGSIQSQLKRLRGQLLESSEAR
jgi:F0F1-type ATP synthase delta subunit